MEKLRESAKSGQDKAFAIIHDLFNDLGLEVYTHNFTLNFPFGNGKQFQGQNIYAILRAPRASSTEALVLSAPYRSSYSLEAPTDVSIALLLASAKFFRNQNYWAKDIIFLVTQHEMLGVQAWLEAYHQVSSGSLGVVDHGDLEARAGAIQAAINLEFSQERISHINVKVQGLNGQLPNMDLFNLVNRLSMKEGVGQLFQNREEVGRLGSWKHYSQSLRTLTLMMLEQASGTPNGNHGLFHRMGIEAVTLEGVQIRRKKRKYQEADMYQMGRIVEGSFRSLNNLLERFHQSFFYYVLPSSSRYVSIGMYMPGFGILAAGLLLPAFSLWLESLAGNASPKVSLPDVFGIVLPPFLACHAAGLILLNLPLPTSQLNTHLKLNLHYEHAVVYALTVCSLVLILVPLVFRVSAKNYRILKCFTLLELAAVSFTVSLSNFSLSYLITAFVIGPLACLARPPNGFLKRMGLSLLMLAAHPLVLSYILCTADVYRLDGNDMSLVKVLHKGLGTTEHALMYGIIDSYIYGNLTYALGCLSYFPIWSLLWSIVHAKY